MMTTLDGWIKQATRGLSKDSAAQVIDEIREHYELAREAAMAGGACGEQAEQQAIAALGNAKLANREYCKVLLTSREARMLREGNWEARAVCSRSWLKWGLLAIPLVALIAAMELLVKGSVSEARLLLAGGVCMGVLLAGPFLPVYTPKRAQTFRIVKWLMLTGIFVVAFDSLWLLIACLWPLAWVEWTRMSIRRKLPVPEWPKQLYL